MHLTYALSLLLFFASSLVAYDPTPSVSDQVWNLLEPYFVPENSSEKEILDHIFSGRRSLSSLKSLSDSGFLIITNPKDKILVLQHPLLKGYLVKVYLDTQEMAEWDCWLRRARGCRVIQDAILRHGYSHLFKVPKKWIYPLPLDPPPNKKSSYPKSFILLVEKMDILPEKSNRKAFKQQMTIEKLNALYHLLTQYQLIDSVYADNIPFCKDGRIAFIDTEWTGDTTIAVPLTAVGQYLSSEMLPYWEYLLVNGWPIEF